MRGTAWPGRRVCPAAGCRGSPAAAWVTVGGTRLRVARVDVTAGMIVVHAQARGPLAGVTGPARLYDGTGRLVYGGWSIGEVYAVTGGAMLTVTLPMQIS